MTTTRNAVGKAAALVLAVLVGALTLAGCSTGTVSTATPQEWLKAAAQPGVVIVDVRTPTEYAAGHVAGAINLEVQAADFATKLADLDPQGTYALYCQSGRRSGLAASQMEKAGFTDVTNLKGGIADLQAAGATIVTN